jgi:hypothetical protein
MSTRKAKTLADVFTRKRKRTVQKDDTDSASSEERFLRKLEANSKKRNSMLESAIRKSKIQTPLNWNANRRIGDSAKLVADMEEVQKIQSDNESVQSAIIVIKRVQTNDQGIVKVEETKQTISYPTSHSTNHLLHPVQTHEKDSPDESTGYDYDTDETIWTIRPSIRRISPSSLLTRSTNRSDRTETVGKSPSIGSTSSTISSHSRKSKNSKKSTSSKRNRNYKKKPTKDIIIILERNKWR